MIIIDDDKLKNESDNQIIDFLKDAVTYLENRIAIVDNKASVLIAVQGVFFALLAYTINEVFLTTYQSPIIEVSYAVFGGAFVIFIPTVLLLLQTIRPSKMIIGFEVPINKMALDNYIMWFDGDKFPTTSDNYLEKINAIDLSKIKENYENLHFITLQMVRRKYYFYRWAVVGMELLVLWSALGIVVLAYFKLIT